MIIPWVIFYYYRLFNKKLFKIILGCSTLVYFRFFILKYSIIGYCKLLYTFGYYWLFHFRLFSIILNYQTLCNFRTYYFRLFFIILIYLYYFLLFQKKIVLGYFFVFQIIPPWTIISYSKLFKDILCRFIIGYVSSCLV